MCACVLVCVRIFLFVYVCVRGLVNMVKETSQACIQVFVYMVVIVSVLRVCVCVCRRVYTGVCVGGCDC